MPKHFLHLSDYTSDELWELLKLAKELKTKFKNKETYKPFDGKSLAMIFAKPSARTRVSFETGFEWMGGHALFLGPNDIGIGKREAIKDISRVFSRYNDMIMARLFDHKHIVELAKYSNDDIPEFSKIFTVLASGSYPLGLQQTKCIGNLVANCNQECTILLPSPT